MNMTSVRNVKHWALSDFRNLGLLINASHADFSSRSIKTVKEFSCFLWRRFQIILLTAILKSAAFQNQIEQRLRVSF